MSGIKDLTLDRAKFAVDLNKRTKLQIDNKFWWPLLDFAWVTRPTAMYGAVIAQLNNNLIYVPNSEE